MYDYLIVGAGLFGSVVAHELKKQNKKCLVIDKRPHIGGNIYTEKVEGINVHKYGAHIFHTSDESLWNYIRQFAAFNHYVNSPLANYKGEVFNLPFNMNTFARMWNISTPHEALRIIDSQRKEISSAPKNLEEKAISLVGRDIYEKLIKGYTEKQWGRSCLDLPGFIINRLPVRFTYNNNYFKDRFQGIPVGGYTKIIENMLDGIPVELNADYLKRRSHYDSIAKKIIYTGAIDAYYDFLYGPLQYRSIHFETEVLDSPNYQGNAVVNYTHKDVPYTRIIEHKHFEFGDGPKTVISREFSREWSPGMEPYYPVNDERNTEVFEKYKELSLKEDKVIFGGRLGEYKYYDMDKTIYSALSLVIKLSN